MKTVIHRGNTRGFADHGWLQSYHTFSFAGYYNPERIHFGALRVLNDDTVKGGMGFGGHPHDNMEIISIPLSGALEHKDNTGRHKIINQHDVQIMSAGTGIQHSEFNASKTETVKFLQIWLFPKVKDIQPRYDQKTFDPANRHNKLQVVVAPEESEETLFINQDAWFSLGKFDKGQTLTYSPKLNGNGAYLLVLNGQLKVGEEILENRDAIAVSDYDKLDISVQEDAEFLLMDIPMIA
ncbi:pirin family protein [Chitinophaga sp. SYP-B3965]|uniref:pirin family protein n=1 Tax=Chitinophaga sp. SYP-B3965 TaxID=2663120 RepID=UPI0012996F44|nr:pirin family protein [Chitinophaga sp. SYP-B3965]MRG49103.1 pirin family protein [Chitinophaga sp. SYP-B3965]